MPHISGACDCLLQTAAAATELRTNMQLEAQANHISRCAAALELIKWIL